MNDDPFVRIGGRTFLLVLGCGIACTGLVYLGKISDQVFATIIMGTVGLYIGKTAFEQTTIVKTNAEVQKTSITTTGAPTP